MNLLGLNHWHKPKLLLIALSTLVLTGCFGGTMAQQLVRSILMQGADKATAAAMDEHERNEKKAAQYLIPKNTEFDDYEIAFLRSGFELVQPQAEPLPQVTTPPESGIKMVQESKLVNVEVWSLLLGEEKQHLLENASLKGSLLIPPRTEWSRWYVAVGSIENHKTNKSAQAITFLIPPDLGKMRSGDRALVELPGNDELNIARYALN